jgi:hypothetical protein
LILFGFNPFHVGKKLNMVRKRDSFWEHANDLKNGRFSCNFCKKEFPGGITRFKSHLSGVSGHDIQICQQVPPDIQFKAREAIGTPTKRAKCMAASSNVQDVESVLGSSSSHMLNLGKRHDKSKVDKQFAKFFMSWKQFVLMPFNHRSSRTS